MPRFVPNGAKLGKAPADRAALRDAIRAKYFMDASAPSGDSLTDDGLNAAKTVARWGVFESDKLECGVLSALANGAVAARAVRGEFVDFTPGCIKTDYAAASGWDPKDLSTERKLTISEALAYWREEGLVTSTGDVEYIAGYAALKLRDTAELVTAVRMFGWAVVGLRVYKRQRNWYETAGSSANQDAEPPVWTVDSAGGGIAGTVAVPVVGTDADGNLVTALLGRTQRISPEYYAKYSDEAWVAIRFSDLAGETPVRGLRAVQMARALAKLGPGADGAPKLEIGDKNVPMIDGEPVTGKPRTVLSAATVSLTPGTSNSPVSCEPGADVARAFESSAPDVPQPAFSSAGA